MSEWTEKELETYCEKVTRLWHNAEKHQWSLGDFLLTILPFEKNFQASGNEIEKNLHRLSKVTGFSYSTLVEYRRTSNQWPPDKRNLSISYAAHSALNGIESRFEFILQVSNLPEAEEISREERRKTGSGKHVSVKEHARHLPGERMAGISAVWDLIDDMKKKLHRTLDPMIAVVEVSEDFAEGFLSDLEVLRELLEKAENLIKVPSYR